MVTLLVIVFILTIGSLIRYALEDTHYQTPSRDCASYTPSAPCWLGWTQLCDRSRGNKVEHLHLLWLSLRSQTLSSPQYPSGFRGYSEVRPIHVEGEHTRLWMAGGKNHSGCFGQPTATEFPTERYCGNTKAWCWGDAAHDKYSIKSVPSLSLFSMWLLLSPHLDLGRPSSELTCYPTAASSDSQ